MMMMMMMMIDETFVEENRWLRRGAIVESVCQVADRSGYHLGGRASCVVFLALFLQWLGVQVADLGGCHFYRGFVLVVLFFLPFFCSEWRGVTRASDTPT